MRLNTAQRQAVQYTQGPLLILAGAGSGKTRTLTSRAAYILSEKLAYPSEMLCLTFTNKAADEMKTRIERLLGEKADQMWIHTFHSMCARVLRMEAEAIGYKKSFTIYDADDSERLIKQCLAACDMDAKYYPPKSILASISEYKNKMQGPDKMRLAGELWHDKVAQVFELYEKMQKDNNAMDFDNLLIKAVELFEKNPEILEYYSNKFKYIHVDEYQDTNRAQYIIVKLLAKTHRNLCVVGDDDQSIYGWRGADIRNILDFEKDFPEAKVLRLEQNYRSTANILNTANSVIANNTQRKGKTLFTERTGGEPVTVYRAETERDESAFVVHNITRMLDEYRYSDFAVLYRINAQSRVVEETLLREGIPYRVYGGLKFYDRKEVKDVIAYLRFLNNPDDGVSLARILNVPRRGIGETTLENIRKFTEQDNITMWDVIVEGEKYFKKSVYSKLKKFADSMALLMAKQALLPLPEYVRAVINETGILDQYYLEATDESLARAENIMELLSAVDEFCQASPASGIQEFLEKTALVMDTDTLGMDTEGVTLMTLHSAKGLEFPVVFLIGMEENLCPHRRSCLEPDAVEEERRLCYVGMTRAMDKLFMTYCIQRGMFGNTVYNQPSRFLGELPTEGVERNDLDRYGFVPRYKKPEHKPVFDYIKAPVIQNRQQVQSLRPGDKVNHPAFGTGLVISITGQSGEQYADIAFDNKGIKRISLKYADMKKVN